MAETGTQTPRWYVRRAISGKEAKVKEYLDAEISNKTLAPYVTQVLIPTEKFFQVRNGKRVIKERNSLPGYVLVEAVMVGDVAFKLRNTPNVIGILGGLDNPAPMQDAEIKRLIGNAQDVEQSSEMQDAYIVGEAVKVTEGPFSGFSGVVDEVNNEKKKLTVMVKVFGRNTPLTLGFMQVEKE